MNDDEVFEAVLDAIPMIGHFCQHADTLSEAGKDAFFEQAMCFLEIIALQSRDPDAIIERLIQYGMTGKVGVDSQRDFFFVMGMALQQYRKTKVTLQ